MLFLDNNSLADSSRTAPIPRQVVLHHILVRSPLQLPHALHGWQEAEYVAWLEEHTTEDALSLVEGDLSHWIKMHEAGESKAGSEAKEYIALCRRVLDSSQT
jgi:conserved oligomeric Golgi complex subunit 5